MCVKCHLDGELSDERRGEEFFAIHNPHPAATHRQRRIPAYA